MGIENRFPRGGAKRRQPVPGVVRFARVRRFHGSMCDVKRLAGCASPAGFIFRLPIDRKRVEMVNNGTDEQSIRSEPMAKDTRQTYRTINPSTVKELKKTLSSLPQAKSSELSKSDVIRQLRKEIEVTKDKGYSYRQIAKILSEKAGIPISSQAIQIALKDDSGAARKEAEPAAGPQERNPSDGANA